MPNPRLLPPAAFRFVCRLVLVCPGVALAQTASRPSLEQRITKAESALQRGRAEEAATALRELGPEIRAIPSEVARKPLETAVAEMLTKADPRNEAYAKAFAEAAKPLLRLAETYRKKGWHRSALLLLRQARDLDPESARKPLAELEKLVPAEFAKEAPPRQELRPDASAKALFSGAERIGIPSAWVIDERGLASPPLDPSGRDNLTMLVAKGKLEGDFRYGFEVETKGKLAQSSLVFGYRSSADYWCLDFTDAPNNLLGTVRLLRIASSGTNSDATVSATLDLRHLPPGSFVPIEIEVRGGTLKVSVNRRLAFEKANLEGCDGRFGVMIGQLTPCHEPIRFRNFHTEKL